MRRVSEDDIEEAVDSIMEDVNDHELASPDVSRSSSIDFYKAIMERCKEHHDALREELDAEGEGGDSTDDEEV